MYCKPEMFLVKDGKCITCEIGVEFSWVMTELSTDHSNIIKTWANYYYWHSDSEDSKHTFSEKFCARSWLP